MRLARALTYDPAPRMRMAGCDLAPLLTRYGSPLHVVDQARLSRNAAAFRTRPRGASRGCEVFFSYKTNPVPGVLTLLSEAGIGAEVVSEYEIWLARRLGVPGSRIVFNGPAKTEAAIGRAIREGVGLINVNHAEEVARLSASAVRLGKRARVGLRVATRGSWAQQLGVPVAGGQALAVLETMAAAPGLNVVGVHAHFGHPIRSRATLAGFVDGVLAFADQVRTKLGRELEVLDLGGSLALPDVLPLPLRRGATASRRCLTIADYVREAARRVERHYARRGRRCPRIALEPGRALSGDAQILLTSVVDVRVSRGCRYAILDAGTNLAGELRYERHAIVPLDPRPRARTFSYTLTGPLCSPADVLVDRVALRELRRGDRLAIMDAGAYFVPSSTTFSYPRPAIVAIEKGAARRLRRAETFTDLLTLDEEG